MTVTRVFADRANRYTPSVVRIIVFSKVTSKMNSLPLWSITELPAPDGMVGIGITLTTDTAGSSTWAVAVFAARKRIKTARNHRIEPPDTVAVLYFLRLRVIALAFRVVSALFSAAEYSGGYSLKLCALALA